MSTEEKTIEIINEGSVMSKGPITIHIDYNERLTLKEFSEVLDLINKAINVLIEKMELKTTLN